MRGMKLLFGAALLASCVGVSASSVKKKVDDFDGATRVEVDGSYGLDCGFTMVCGALGAVWLSTHADVVALRVEALNMTSGISGVKLNIDGLFVDLEPAEQLTRFEGDRYVKSSKRDFYIPVDVLRKMVAAGLVKVRIVTRDGFIDATFSGGAKATKAYGAIKEFADAIPTQDAAH